MLPIIRQISAYNHSAPNNIQYLVVHSTGNTTDTAKGNADYFCACNRGASAHLFVDNNNIYQVVEFSDGSWHCGDGGMAYGIGNHNSIGIEMCHTNGTVSEATENNTVELVKYLMAKFNIDINHVVRHYDASRKNCPSPFSANNWARWYNFKSKLTRSAVQNVVVTSAPTQTSTTTSTIPSFTYSNNAKVQGDFLYIRDINGNIISGRQVDDGDNITVLDISYSRQLALVQYPTVSGARSGYVTNATSLIKYYNPYNWHNGSTPEIVYDKPNGVKIGTISAWEKATLLYKSNGWCNVVYSTDKGDFTKSGWVRFQGL